MLAPEKTFYISNENKQLLFGEALAKACHDKSGVIFLQGDLGAGKTTLVRGFLRAMGYQGKVKSPTFTLIETYTISGVEILHIDLYRITNPLEIVPLGIQDQMDDNTICLIEWPERAKEKLPPADLTCYIAPFSEGRQIQMVTHTARGEEMINAMVWACD